MSSDNSKVGINGATSIVLCSIHLNVLDKIDRIKPLLITADIAAGPLVKAAREQYFDVSIGT